MAYKNVKGKISRLYVHSDGCDIRVDSEGEDDFRLSKNHSNYQSIYSLAATAAVNRYKVWLRLGDYEPPAAPSKEVWYIVINWPQ